MVITEKPDYNKIKVSSIDLSNIKATTPSENMAASKQKNVVNYQDDLLKATDLILKAKKDSQDNLNDILAINNRLEETIADQRAKCKQHRDNIETEKQLNYDLRRKLEIASSISIICFIFAIVCLGVLILE